MEAKYSVKTLVDEGNKAFQDGYKAGIKEAVEWINANPPSTFNDYVSFWKKWQSKLQEWGIS